MNEKLRRYYAIRPNMRSGDTLLWSGKYGVIAKLIQWKTRSKINYVSTLIRLTKYKSLRVMQAEAVAKGLQPTVLSQRLEEYKGKVYLLRLKPEYDSAREGKITWILDRLGTPYDYKSIWKQIFSKVSADLKHLFCSETDFMGSRDGGKIDKLQGIKTAPNPGEIESLGIYEKPVRIL